MTIHMTDKPGRHYVADCLTCGTTSASHWYSQCETCRFWTDQFATGGGIIIGGWHYRLGEEPTTEQHAANPDHFGNYGRRYIIRFTDGREVITHNLWDQGPIPPGLTRPDTAEFVREHR